MFGAALAVVARATVVVALYLETIVASLAVAGLRLLALPKQPPQRPPDLAIRRARPVHQYYLLIHQLRSDFAFS